MAGNHRTMGKGTMCHFSEGSLLQKSCYKARTVPLKKLRLITDHSKRPFEEMLRKLEQKIETNYRELKRNTTLKIKNETEGMDYTATDKEMQVDISNTADAPLKLALKNQTVGMDDTERCLPQKNYQAIFRRHLLKKVRENQDQLWQLTRPLDEMNETMDHTATDEIQVYFSYTADAPLNVNETEGMDDTATDEETQVDISNTADGPLNLTLKSKFAAILKNPKQPCQSALVSIIYLNYTAPLREELKDRLDSMLDETTVSPVEKKELHDRIASFATLFKYLNVESISLNNCCLTFEKVWPSSRRGSSESCTDQYGAVNFAQVMQCLAREYLEFMAERIESFRSSEILKFLAVKAGEKAHYPSRSPEEQLPHLLRKVYGSAENTHIYSFRPILNNLSVSKYGMDKYLCPDYKKVSLEAKLRDYQISSQEIIALYSSPPCTSADGRHENCKVVNAAHIVYEYIESSEGRRRKRKKKDSEQMSKHKVPKYRVVGLPVLAEEE